MEVAQALILTLQGDQATHRCVRRSPPAEFGQPAGAIVVRPWRVRPYEGLGVGDSPFDGGEEGRLVWAGQAAKFGREGDVQCCPLGTDGGDGRVEQAARSSA